MTKSLTTAAIAALILCATNAQALEPGPKCEASKNKTAGAYYSCREKAEATAISKSTTPDYSKCTAKFDDKWDGAETTGAGACPDVVLTGPMNTYIAAQAAEAASVIAGAAIPACAADFSTACGDLATCDGDLTTCDGDLATCDGDLATCVGDCVASVRPPLRTGQTLCYDTAGSVIACAGTGQDGQLQKGAARSFTDNGNGTITDNTTGLMWEKLSDDGSIHDLDTSYDWTTAVTTKIATLNSTVFAGHNDWRLPNLSELETLRNLGAVLPATFSAFNTACAPACTATTCSCTQSNGYWSSSTYQNFPTTAWFVHFFDGYTDNSGKTGAGFVRAVRSGS